MKTDTMNGIQSGSFEYCGKELEIFKHAVNWKQYCEGLIAPYLGSRVLEVGAGTGGPTSVLCSARHEN